MSQNVELIRELLEKLSVVENEMVLLREDKKNLLIDYKEKLDVKAFQAAIRIYKIRQQTDNDAVVNEMLDAMGGSDG